LGDTLNDNNNDSHSLSLSNRLAPVKGVAWSMDTLKIYLGVDTKSCNFINIPETDSQASNGVTSVIFVETVSTEAERNGSK